MEDSETSFLVPKHAQHLYQQIKSHDRRRASEKRKKPKRLHDTEIRNKAPQENPPGQI
jgi:hypothetical protein